MAETPKIELRNICKSFGKKVILDNLNISVAKGESLVVIGGSGTGKSVMLKCILGLLKPESGQILIDGEDITNASGHRREQVLRKTGMLFQYAALFDSLTVWENVAFGLIQAHGMKRGPAKEIAIQKLSLVGLGADLADKRPAELSIGMQKRVGLARAIAAEPEIIFFDEPTTGLDPIMGDVIDTLIRDCTQDLGATTLTISHDMESAQKIADRIALLYKGNVVWAGPATDINTCGDPYVEQFVHGDVDGPIKVDILKP
ncbi:ATP-binding cassette domain-containing protein [Sneathiella chungangensis]|uniref:ATP-binding cassette domain-containing protein n=1 Tax=Sneathiella chungangensis TaxID=1418234 RepID=A0A845MB01_9PROT|nr:ATP-binding cassette domain-containing protein [Sneathiella chungangensis]MZR21423.1 ATP-binding cassette domain-containing protein [Sneathiella chungangensis]